MDKILVVDDEKEIADLIEVYLKSENYTVYKFYTGSNGQNLAGQIFIIIFLYCRVFYLLGAS